MSAASATERTLQPAAWRRAIGPMAVAVILLSVVLQEPIAALLPAETPRWIVFLAIAVPAVAAIVFGLSIAYPRVRVGSDGALLTRGRRIPLTEIVRVLRSVSSGGNAGYLVYTLETAGSRRVRVLVAGAPVRGLGGAELAALRDVIADSAIPLGADPAALDRSFIGADLLASGRRVETDRRVLLRELDGLRGVPHRPDAEPARAVEVAAAEAQTAGTVDDDRAAERQLAVSAAGTHAFRRVALVVFVVACLFAVALLIVLVVMESLGTDFGAVDEDPLTATMSIAILAALLAGILWAVATDADDARRRTLSRGWLETASAEQLARGLPAPFHAAWMRAPGGRMTGLGLFVLAMVAISALVGGPVALAGAFGPPAVSILVTIAGIVLAGLALWGRFARRRAHARRIEWLLEVAGERVQGEGLPES